MGEYFRHMTYTDRIKIEALNNRRIPVKEIAKEIGFSISAVYRELARGHYMRMKTTLEMKDAYSADIAQRDHDYRASNKGAPLKIAHDYDFVDYVEHKIVNEHYSPDVLIGELRKKGSRFQTDICTKTLYNYIDQNLFLHLSNNDLLHKRNQKKRRYHVVRRIKNPLCRSIEDRPEDVETRAVFGHWEMDTVYSPQDGKKTALLVLTERKTRQEIIRKIKDRTQNEVSRAMNALERKLGAVTFRRMFKTITIDNGSEFLDAEKLERSCLAKTRKRTTVYYCHPYSSWERGSNENMNAMIRRFIPKGKDIDCFSDKDIARIQSWINCYPRKILDYECPNDLFVESTALIKKGALT